MTNMLVSVRSVAEALLAAEGGADIIDLKEPGDGALGGLPMATIVAVVAALRERRITLPVSATIGDLPMQPLAPILARVQAVADCGVDYVKVGIESAPAAAAVLDALSACGHPVVPVFIADHGLDFAQVERVGRLGFPALMVDTADKRAGSLFDLMGAADVRRFLLVARAAGALAGLAGALRLEHVPAVLALAPDYAGFRSAVCAGDRTAALDAPRLTALAAAMHQHPATTGAQPA